MTLASGLGCGREPSVVPLALGQDAGNRSSHQSAAWARHGTTHGVVPYPAVWPGAGLCGCPGWYRQKHKGAGISSKSPGQQCVASEFEVRDVAPEHPGHVLSSTAMRGLLQSIAYTAAQDTSH